jgi:hypothetical protein
MRFPEKQKSASPRCFISLNKALREQHRYRVRIRASRRERLDMCPINDNARYHFTRLRQ